MSTILGSLRRLKQRWRLTQEARRTQHWCRRARRLVRQPSAGGRVLVLVSGRFGSIGDEAMVLSARAGASRQGVAHATLVSYGSDEPWPLPPGYDRVLNLSRRFSSDFWSTCADWLQALHDATHFYIIGADVMDGHYSPYECRQRVVFARMAHAAGLRTVVLGFSFNRAPHPLAVAALASLPPSVKLFARDPLSLERLRTALKRPVDLSADIAFLLEPAADTPLLDDLRPWLAGERSAGRLAIGVNASVLAAAAGMCEQEGRPLAMAWAAGLAAFAEKRPSVSYLLIPHDYRRAPGLPNDHDLAEAIAAALPPDVRAHCRVVPQPAHAPEIKTLTSHLDLVLTGRMHLAIAAIGSGTPAGGVVYQDKFEGLFQHLGLPPLCLDPARLADPQAVCAFLVELARQQAQYTAIIRANLPRIHELSAANFAAAGPPIAGDT
jgi:polysaccharide pyruvyl transferase WcaK-like protein